MEIKIGAVAGALELTERIRLPILEDLGVIAWVTDVLDFVVAHRKGGLIIGEKGSGKTFAARRALRSFAEAEQMYEKHGDEYRHREVLFVPQIRGSKPRDVICALYKAATGAGPSPRAGSYYKTDDDLLDETIRAYEARNAVAVVIDEGEQLSREALGVLESFMSRSETMSDDRYEEGTYVPAGIGVVLLGTGRLRELAASSPEWGRRWVRMQEVGLVEADQVPGVYLRFLPGFEEHVDEIGEAAWDTFIEDAITHGEDQPLSFIENHVRTYVRRMRMAEPDLEDLGDVPFHEEIFDHARRHTLRPELARRRESA